MDSEDKFMAGLFGFCLLGIVIMAIIMLPALGFQGPRTGLCILNDGHPVPDILVQVKSWAGAQTPIAAGATGNDGCSIWPTSLMDGWSNTSWSVTFTRLGTTFVFHVHVAEIRTVLVTNSS